MKILNDLSEVFFNYIFKLRVLIGLLILYWFIELFFYKVPEFMSIQQVYPHITKYLFLITLAYMIKVLRK